MRKYFFPLIVFLSLFNGCSSVFTRLEYGPASQFAIGRIINEDSTGLRSDGRVKGGMPMNGHYTSFKIGVKNDLSDDIRLSIAAGPALFVPTKGPDGSFYSVDATPRLTYTGWKHLHPYVEGLVGVGNLEKRWEGEATKWQFSTGGGIGVMIPLKKHFKVDIGYRLYHISNGSAIFNSPRPNVGYNTDLVLFGIRYNF